MDIISFGEAKKAQKAVGALKDLKTDAKQNTVSAINELKDRVDTIEGSKIEMLTYEIGVVGTEEVKAFTMPFIEKGTIKGIKCLAGYDTEDFYLAIFTKNPLDGGEYVYASGRVTTVLWDIMDIPFIDESEENTIYCELYNMGVSSNFTLKIYYTE